MSRWQSHSSSLVAFQAPPPPLALAMEAPRKATPLILSRLAPLFLPEGRRLCVADNANSFDPYPFSLQARRRGIPDDVLDRVFVTRTFTIHQLAGVAELMLPPLLDEPRPPAIAILGLDYLFLEESLRAAERAAVLQDVMRSLGRLRRNGARLLVTYERPPARQQWWKPMLEFGDVSAQLLAHEDGWNLKIKRCDYHGTDTADIQYLASEGDRILEGLSPGFAG